MASKTLTAARIDQKNKAQKGQSERRIEQRGHGGRREKFAQCAKVAEPLSGTPAGTQIVFEHGIEHPLSEPRLEHHAGLVQHLPAHTFHDLHHEVHPEHQQSQHGERGVAAAVQHAVVDLEHVQRRRKRKRIDDDADERRLLQDRLDLLDNLLEPCGPMFLVGHRNAPLWPVDGIMHGASPNSRHRKRNGLAGGKAMDR